MPELDVIWKRHWNQLSHLPAVVSNEPPLCNSSEDIDGAPYVHRKSVRIRVPVDRYGYE